VQTPTVKNLRSNLPPPWVWFLLKPAHVRKCFKVSNIEMGKVRHGLVAHFVSVKRACSYSMSIYTNTIFEGSKLPISKELRKIYCWAIGFGVRKS
jgi:hypothetical protein